MSGTRQRRRLAFSDHHRQRYADKVRLPEAGEFLIGVYNDDGSVDLDGEFRVTLVELDGIVYPRLEAYGEAAGALQRALDLGLLDVLGPVSGRDEFSRRLLADRAGRPIRPVAARAATSRFSDKQAAAKTFVIGWKYRDDASQPHVPPCPATAALSGAARCSAQRNDEGG